MPDKISSNPLAQSFAILVLCAVGILAFSFLIILPSKKSSADLDKDIEYIVSLGVDMNYNTQVGKDITFELLLQDYDAILLSTGLWVPSSMRIEGEEHPRVLSGLQVLADVASGLPSVGCLCKSKDLDPVIRYRWQLAADTDRPPLAVEAGITSGDVELYGIKT